jgi:hypothetical protein
MTVGLMAIVALSVVAQAAAGSSFRLEVGPPVAAGTDFKAKKAVIVVRSRLCADEASVRITGTAEGIINGQRRSVPLTLVSLPTPGVHAVQRQWPEGGEWVLHLRGTCPALKVTASTIVPPGKNGFIREKTQVLSEPATAAQVDAALRDLNRAAS